MRRAATSCVLQRCRALRRSTSSIHAPRARAASSGDVEWRRMSGRGTLHTFTVVHRGAEGLPARDAVRHRDRRAGRGPAHDDATWSASTPDPAKIRSGMPVEVVFEDVTADDHAAALPARRRARMSDGEAPARPRRDRRRGRVRRASASCRTSRRSRCTRRRRATRSPTPASEVATSTRCFSAGL